MAFKRQVDQAEAETYAERNAMGFFEVSPLVNFNISETFVELARMALKRNGMERLWRSNKGKINPFFVWFLGVDTFHRMESGYPLRDFASRPDRAYKLDVQIMACLFQDLQIGIQIIAWIREGSYGQFYPNTT